MSKHLVSITLPMSVRLMGYVVFMNSSGTDCRTDTGTTHLKGTALQGSVDRSQQTSIHRAKNRGVKVAMNVISMRRPTTASIAPTCAAQSVSGSWPAKNTRP